MKDKQLREEVKQLTALVAELSSALGKFLEIEAKFHTQLQIFLESGDNQGAKNSHESSDDHPYQG